MSNIHFDLRDLELLPSPFATSIKYDYLRGRILYTGEDGEYKEERGIFINCKVDKEKVDTSYKELTITIRIMINGIEKFFLAEYPDINIDNLRSDISVPFLEKLQGLLRK